MTQSATAHTKTDHASKYLQQLCKHWSHKAQAEFTPETGTVTFASGNRLTMTAQPDHLTLQVSVPTGSDLAHFQEVVDNHLLRFAFREDLSINWTATA